MILDIFIDNNFYLNELNDELKKTAHNKKYSTFGR